MAIMAESVEEEEQGGRQDLALRDPPWRPAKTPASGAGKQQGAVRGCKNSFRGGGLVHLNRPVPTGPLRHLLKGMDLATWRCATSAAFHCVVEGRPLGVERGESVEDEEVEAAVRILARAVLSAVP